MLDFNAKCGQRSSQQASRFAISLLGVMLLVGCEQQMSNQRRAESQEQTAAFPGGNVSQGVPERTVAASRSALESVSLGPTHPNRRWMHSAEYDDSEGYLSGKAEGKLVDSLPAALVEHGDYEALLRRGKERFNISCAPCHDQTGSGNGMVARRGFKFPPSYHSDRLRQQPLGYIFNVVTHGRGQMPAYGDFLSTDDRWAIAAYVRTLQFSQQVPVSELSAAEVQEADRWEKQDETRFSDKGTKNQ